MLQEGRRIRQKLEKGEDASDRTIMDPTSSKGVTSKSVECAQLGHVRKNICHEVVAAEINSNSQSAKPVLGNSLHVLVL